MGGLSRAEKLLVAAGKLTGSGQTNFSAEDLIVQAYKEFPLDFSLKGYDHFPDSNSVLTQIMGKKAPLIVRGWLEKTGTKQYRLTPKGSHDLGGLDQTVVDVPGVHIERALEEGLGRLLTSPAFEMYKHGSGDEITFHQFTRFAGLTAPDKLQKIVGKLESLKHLTEVARQIGESEQLLRIHFRDRNYTFTSEDLRMLEALLNFLTNRFKPEMEEWKRNAST